MYKRSEVCALTAIEVNSFKTLARRGQLPTTSQEESGYTDLDVLAIAAAERLACQIGYPDGLSRDAASKIVANAIGMIDRPLTITRSDQWIGYVGQPVDRGGHVGGFNVGGTLSEVFTALKRNDESSPVERLFLVNLTEVLRTIQQRAAAIGIKFPSA